MSLPTYAQFAEKITQFFTASDKSHTIVNGDDETEVTTVSGLLPTFAKLFKDFREKSVRYDLDQTALSSELKLQARQNTNSVENSFVGIVSAIGNNRLPLSVIPASLTIPTGDPNTVRKASVLIEIADQPNDGDLFTVYDAEDNVLDEIVWRNVPTTVFDVEIGVDMAASIDNLSAYIFTNITITLVEGVQYRVESIVYGAAGNNLRLSATNSNVTFGWEGYLPLSGAWGTETNAFGQYNGQEVLVINTGIFWKWNSVSQFWIPSNGLLIALTPALNAIPSYANLTAANATLSIGSIFLNTTTNTLQLTTT